MPAISQPDHLKHKIEFIVCDVSFISLKLALPAALALAEPGAQLLALIKPQFEAGRDAVGRGGIVSDPHEHDRVCKEISEFLTAENWRVIGITPSSIEGGDGNREFLIAAVKELKKFSSPLWGGVRGEGRSDTTRLSPSIASVLGFRPPHKGRWKGASAARSPHLRPVPQEMIGQHQRHHRFGNRHRANADAGVMAALGDDIRICPLRGDRLTRCENR